MTWLQRYQVRRYIGDSIWLLPVLGALTAVVVVRLFYAIEMRMGWVSPLDADTARAVLGTLASSLFTSVIFVCTALLVAVQLASAALSPRIIGLVFRDPVTKFSLTLLAFTFTFSLSALLRIKTNVPSLTAHTAIYANLFCLAVFLYLIDHMGKALRPSGALQSVARQARTVIESVYPMRLADSSSAVSSVAPEGTNGSVAAHHLEGEPIATIPSPTDGVVLAFDQSGLLALAQKADCVIAMVPQVGDHVSKGDPLFRIYSPQPAVRASGDTTMPENALWQSVAIGQERTIEQDPTFAFRIMVDIANKGLSPAINDPTTAVLALDSIHSLLRVVAKRRLHDGIVRDTTGQLRLVYRTPDWQDFVCLAVTEIRHFGGPSIQIARRLRAMLENLIATLPETRGALLRQELALLHRTAERCFPEPEDRALAEISDLQGVGGKHEHNGH